MRSLNPTQSSVSFKVNAATVIILLLCFTAFCRGTNTITDHDSSRSNVLEGNSDGLPPDLDRKVGETDKDRQTAKIKITAAKPRPHILFILADDLGWNDVGWHSTSDLDTPNLSRLAQRGIIFNQSYAQSICSPSRAALLSGRYPFTIGMHVSTVDPLRPYGLPTDVPLLSDYLQKLGYSTHAVGKWHLGYCKKEYTPTKRGFDSFYGFHAGNIGYFEHENVYRLKGTKQNHTDFWRNLNKVGDKVKGEYTTFLLADEVIKKIFDHKSNGDTQPMFIYLAFSAPHGPFEVLGKNNEWDGTRQSSRQIYGAMVSAMDVAIGRIIKALRATKMISNTLVVFTSDNGGTEHEGNNYPLRGIKSTLYEGGLRVPTFVYAPRRLLRHRKYTTNSLIHITDWFPTLYSIAGGSAKDLPKSLTGHDFSGTIFKKETSPRKEMVYNLYTKKGQLLSGAIRDERFKLIMGKQGKDKNFWYCTAPLIQQNASLCKPATYNVKEVMPAVVELNIKTSFSLFDLENDPSETKNLLVGVHRHSSSEQHHILQTFHRMLDRLYYYEQFVKPSTLLAASCSVTSTYSLDGHARKLAVSQPFQPFSLHFLRCSLFISPPPHFCHCDVLRPLVPVGNAQETRRRAVNLQFASVKHATMRSPHSKQFLARKPELIITGVCLLAIWQGISAKPNCQRSNSVEVNLDGPLSDRETDDCQSTQAKAQERPHILLILADDLGWNDVGWHSTSDLQTPNLSYLAQHGIIFNQSYAQSICSPSRAALLSGRYPFTIGMHVSSVDTLRPYGLPTDVPLLSDYLKQLGYSTHAVGKWHLGHCNASYTPTNRGFDSFYGYYTGSVGYFHRENVYKIRGEKHDYTDFWRNLNQVREEGKGEYTTFLLADEVIKQIFDHRNNRTKQPMFIYLAFSAPHGPFEALAKDNQWKSIQQSSRQIYDAMVSAMDAAIGRIMRALQVTKLFNNTLVVFTSDNGGTQREGNNYPLRGTKGTLYEGGVRVPTFVYGPKRLLPHRKYTTNSLIHISDWLPTLYSIAGGSAQDLPSGVTGYDFSDTIFKKASPPRKEMVYNLHTHTKKHRLLSGAIRNEKFKLIVGEQKRENNFWYCTLPLLQQNATLCKPTQDNIRQAMPVIGPDHKMFSLFDLENDPSETRNLLIDLHHLNRSEHDNILQTFYQLLDKLQYYTYQVAPSVRRKKLKTENRHLEYGQHGWC
ncbi:uncharacterized protein LOC134196859 [Corticium candelabrum]|uniref:uncharacterized protein LOC134196859 n=1 Tax=Corticium candelabrum TaxID=121492 RepID=UPI002E2698EA|nr:uncharacterized protein LOC134196859 [Corticium candelabrum]